MLSVPPILRSAVAGAPRLFSRLYAIDHLLNHVPPPARVMEIGPGLGDLSAHLLQRYLHAQLTLAEISVNAVAGLQKRFHHERRVTISHENFLLGNQGCRSFDLVIACEVFEHIEDDAAAFDAVAALMEPGGYFLFSAPCHMKKWQTSDVLVGHYRRYERPDLIEKFESAGFAIDELWTFGFPSVDLIQPIREVYYRIRKRRSTTDRQAATEGSGIDRPRAMRYAKWAVLAALLPLLRIESLFWRKELGDGFLALAQKR
ncbi:MAG: class I SAM-dependent methyltransferase [Chthoniobacterales bacterium]|nr:class I SAM-dependent methyltransferase [Chthoniobacterales bacterium]